MRYLIVIAALIGALLIPAPAAARPSAHHQSFLPRVTRAVGGEPFPYPPIPARNRWP